MQNQPMKAEIKKYMAIFDPYKITSQGDNPWTKEALLNVAFYRHWYAVTTQALGGTINSGYRCDKINKIVGGAKNSSHVLGLALDIDPGARWNPESAARYIYDTCNDGRYGPISKVIIEPTWVHISWWPPFEIGNVQLMRKVGKKYPIIASKNPDGV